MTVSGPHSSPAGNLPSGTPFTVTPSGQPARADDIEYPAYSMGAAADLLGVEPAFLRALGRNGLINPQRSDGGHRRYSRREVDLAARAREVIDEGMSMAAACRIVILERQLRQTEAALALLQRRLDDREQPAARDRRSR
jgi:DNA-binding transcriptional MerR regulator